MRALVFLAGLAIVGQCCGLTLEEALQRALEEAPPLRKAEYQVAMQQAAELQAGLWPNPTFTADVGSFGGNGNTQGWGESTGTYTYTQPLAIGGRIEAQRVAAAWATCVALWDLMIQRADLIEAVQLAYVDAVTAQELLGLARERLKIAQAHCDLKKEEKSLLARKKAALALHNATEACAKAERAAEGTRQALARFWDADPDFEALEAAWEKEPLLPCEDLIALLPNSVDVLHATATYWANQAAMTLERRKSIPDVDLSAGIATWGCQRRYSYFVEVAVPLPFYDRNQGNIAQADLAAWQSLYQTDAVLKDLTTRLQSAYRAYEQDRHEADQENVNYAHEIWVTAQDEKVDESDIHDAHNSFLDAQESTLNATAEATRKRIEIQRLIYDL